MSLILKIYFYLIVQSIHNEFLITRILIRKSRGLTRETVSLIRLGTYLKFRDMFMRKSRKFKKVSSLIRKSQSQINSKSHKKKIRERRGDITIAKYRVSKEKKVLKENLEVSQEKFQNLAVS